MYLYFDKTGKLKEIINDEALRQGNYGVNKIYVYIEDVEFSRIDVAYLLPSDLIVGPMACDTFSESPEYIPFNPKRDLKFFSYSKKYTFLIIDVSESDINSNSALDEAGVVHCEMAAILSNGGQLMLGDVNFCVEASAVLNQKQVASQEYLSLSDYLFLKKLTGQIEPLTPIGYIPYTGATGDVDLGDNDLTAKELYEGENRVASREWVKDFLGYNSAIPEFLLEGDLRIYNGLTTTFTLGPSDWQLDIKRDRLIGHVDGLATILLLPLEEEAEGDSVTKTLATTESTAKSIEVSADGSVPYRYNFKLKNADGTVISTDYVDLAAESVQADLETYVDNAINALKDDVEDGTVVAKKADTTDFTNGEFTTYDLSENDGIVDLQEAGFYYIILDLGAGEYVCFGLVMVDSNILSGYTNGVPYYQKHDSDEYVLVAGFNANTYPRPQRVMVYKNGNAYEEDLLLVKRIK